MHLFFLWLLDGDGDGGEVNKKPCDDYDDDLDYDDTQIVQQYIHGYLRYVLFFPFLVFDLFFDLAFNLSLDLGFNLFFVFLWNGFCGGLGFLTFGDLYPQLLFPETNDNTV